MNIKRENIPWAVCYLLIMVMTLFKAPQFGILILIVMPIEFWWKGLHKKHKK